MTGVGERRLARLRVLVVDDHPDTLDILDQMLTHAGATVRTATSAREAVSFVSEVDVVVTDYSMPGETGVWLLERVREKSAALPVIALSGFVPHQVPALADAPFSRILLKPIELRDLINEILSALRARHRVN